MNNNIFRNYVQRPYDSMKLSFTFDFFAQTFDEMMSSVKTELNVTIIHKSIAEFTGADKDFQQADNKEKYAIEITEQITIFADSVRALAYALDSLQEMTNEHGAVSAGLYTAYPSFKIRGLVEGFYGKPWTMEQRKEALGILSKNRMNTYIYGPKDDPLHRDFWRVAYNEYSIEPLKQILKMCDDNHITLYYMLAPGLDIKYHDEGEINVIVDKLMQVYTLGIRHFGILFDDIPEEFIYPEDAKMFKTLAGAHASVVNKVYDKLMARDDSIEIVTCPMQYFGEPNEPYITEFGQGVTKDCMVYFTGEKICSAKITSEQAQQFMASTGHKPFYWDNYPVNDMEMVNEFHIGPIINRDADLYKYCEGITLNPMEFAKSSLINIITYADYLWDSDAYCPDTSYERAVGEVAGKEYYKPFKYFNEFLYKSCLLQHGFHYRFMQPTGYNDELVHMIGESDFEAIAQYMKTAKAQIEKLSTLPTGFYNEMFRWHETALVCCDVFTDVAEHLGKGGNIKEVLPTMLDYLCRAEDILKYEMKLLIQKNLV